MGRGRRRAPARGRDRPARHAPGRRGADERRGRGGARRGGPGARRAALRRRGAPCRRRGVGRRRPRALPRPADGTEAYAPPPRCAGSGRRRPASCCCSGCGTHAGSRAAQRAVRARLRRRVRRALRHRDAPPVRDPWPTRRSTCTRPAAPDDDHEALTVLVNAPPHRPTVPTSGSTGTQRVWRARTPTACSRCWPSAAPTCATVSSPEPGRRPPTSPAARATWAARSTARHPRRARAAAPPGQRGPVAASTSSAGRPTPAAGCPWWGCRPRCRRAGRVRLTARSCTSPTPAGARPHRGTGPPTEGRPRRRPPRRAPAATANMPATSTRVGRSPTVAGPGTSAPADERARRPPCRPRTTARAATPTAHHSTTPPRQRPPHPVGGTVEPRAVGRAGPEPRATAPSRPSSRPDASTHAGQQRSAGRRGGDRQAGDGGTGDGDGVGRHPEPHEGGGQCVDDAQPARDERRGLQPAVLLRPRRGPARTTWCAGRLPIGCPAPAGPVRSASAQLPGHPDLDGDVDAAGLDRHLGVHRLEPRTGPGPPPPDGPPSTTSTTPPSSRPAASACCSARWRASSRPRPGPGRAARTGRPRCARPGRARGRHSPPRGRRSAWCQVKRNLAILEPQAGDWGGNRRAPRPVRAGCAGSAYQLSSARQ